MRRLRTLDQIIFDLCLVYLVCDLICYYTTTNQVGKLIEVWKLRNAGNHLTNNTVQRDVHLQLTTGQHSAHFNDTQRMAFFLGQFFLLQNCLVVRNCS